MAHLDVPGILAGSAEDLIVVLLDITRLQALMADTHLSDAAHAAIQALLDKFNVRRHYLEGLQKQAQSLQGDGYPDDPSVDLLQVLKEQILAELQHEEDVVHAEQAAIEELFTAVPLVVSGTIDFEPPVKRG